MKKRKFFKMATLGILGTMILGATTYVSAASGYAFSAGYNFGDGVDTTTAMTYAANVYDNLGYTSRIYKWTYL